MKNAHEQNEILIKKCGKYIKKNLELKNSVNKMKNAIEIICRMESKINEIQQRNFETIYLENNNNKN